MDEIKELQEKVKWLAIALGVVCFSVLLLAGIFAVTDLIKWNAQIDFNDNVVELSNQFERLTQEVTYNRDKIENLNFTQAEQISVS